jgi:biopolymer transport protein ExbD
MGKIKVKRKSTLIDMTAMSDVTVLLLTFFMLTSTFLQKEPTQVVTPPSVSTQKIQLSNVAQVLVATSENDKDTPKVYISVTGEANPDIPEDNPGAWSSENLRKEVLKNAIALYKEGGGKDPGITNEDIDKFAKVSTFGVPISKIHEFFSLDQTKQDEWLSDLDRKDSGIPLINYLNTKELDANGNPVKTNEFQIWMRAIFNATPYDEGLQTLNYKMRKTGEGIAVKADRGTSFHTVNKVLENLRTIKMNKFTVMTALKEE